MTTPNAPATSTPQVLLTPTTAHYSIPSEELEQPAPSPEIEIAAANSRQFGALMTVFVPEHPLTVLTASHIADLPNMSWLLVGFPTDKHDEHGHIITLE